NAKSEIRNPKQAPNPNERFSKPNQSAHRGRLGFEDLLLCSLEFVSDFGFRISDFGSCPPLLPKRRCPAEENVGKDQCSSGEGRGEGSIAAQHVRFLWCFIIVRCSANILRGFSKGDLDAAENDPFILCGDCSALITPACKISLLVVQCQFNIPVQIPIHV